MNDLRNWLRCLRRGHRYDITNLDLQRLVYCECCGRELFNRVDDSANKSMPVAKTAHTTEVSE